MRWRRHGRDKARAYHHGNLKEALVQAAMELIAEKGPSGFTFAEAARSAGVSPAAPYRHFRDRDQLLADVARRGFVEFEAMLVRAWNQARPDPLTAFEQVGKAYLEFARKEPAYYSAMFEAGLPLDPNPELREASDRAFAILRAASEALLAGLPPPASPPGADGRATRLGAFAWNRLAVRAWRCRPAHPTYVSRRTARGRRARVSARARRDRADSAGRPSTGPLKPGLDRTGWRS